jgi:hypothetical protein
MSNPKAKKNIFTAVFVFGVLMLIVLGCKSLSVPGAKMNMFEGTNAQDGAAKIKAKLGVDEVKVSRMEIRQDRLSITVQDPKKPKNFDEYTYESGAVAGPTPVPAMTVGNQEFTADKSRLFNLSEVNLGLVPEVCRKAAERAQIEDGKCEIISVDWEHGSWTRSKEENDKLRAARKEELQKRVRSGTYDIEQNLRESGNDLVVTWRVWIKGPRATKDFWVDSKGTVWDYH